MGMQGPNQPQMTVFLVPIRRLSFPMKLVGLTTIDRGGQSVFKPRVVSTDRSQFHSVVLCRGSQGMTYAVLTLGSLSTPTTINQECGFTPLAARPVYCLAMC